MKVTLVGGRKDGDVEDIPDGVVGITYKNTTGNRVRYVPTNNPEVWSVASDR